MQGFVKIKARLPQASGNLINLINSMDRPGTATMPGELKTSIQFPPFVRGRLIKRYKRFLADVELDDGRMVTAHCPNSGRMTSCCEPGRPVYLSSHDNPRRKLKYTWELIDMPSSMVGVNTLVPNRLVHISMQADTIAVLGGYSEVKREVSVASGSRLDLAASGPDRRTCYIEIKNCTLVEGGAAMFPDAVTARGKKHLLELWELVQAGHRSVMFFLVQRMDAELFKPADHIDPAYGRELRGAFENGVEIIVYDVSINPESIHLNRELPFQL